MASRHSVSVAAAIVDDRGRILAVRRRDNGHWEPPGGVLELNETINDGLLREVSEETGLTVQPVALTGAYKNMAHGIVSLVFLCRPTSGTPRANDENEVTAIRWLDRADIAKHMDEAYAVRVLDALDFHGRATIRAHDGTHVLSPSP